MSSSPRGESAKENFSDKELLNEGSEEKSLEECICEDQDRFMKEIRETLSANITKSIKDAIGSVLPGVEQKITTLTEKIEGQSGEFRNLRVRMAAFEVRVAALEKKERDAKENEASKALEEEVLRELQEEELRLIVMGYEFQESESNLEERLVCDIMREGAELPGRVKIV